MKISELIPFLQVLISGIFGIVVALLTWSLASWREKRKFKQEFFLRDYHDKEKLYVELFASLEKTIRVVKSGSDLDLNDELSITSAKSTLLTTPKINKKIEELSEAIYKWSSAHAKGQLKKIGDTSFALVSSTNLEYKEKAYHLYAEVSEKMYELINEIKDELRSLKENLHKHL